MTDAPQSNVPPIVSAAPITPAGWYPDGAMAGTQRYWDGTAWTDQVAPLAPVLSARKGTVRIVLGWVFGAFALIALFEFFGGLHVAVWGLLIWGALSAASFVGGYGARKGTRT